MSLQRTAIRNQALKQLQENITGISSWNKNRFRPYWQEEELPALSVYTISEQAQVFDESPRRYRKRLQLAVEIIIQATEEAKIEEQIDALCGAVEQAFYKDDTIGETVSDIIYISTELTEKPEGDMQTASAVMVFEAIYHEYAPLESDLRNFMGGDFEFTQPEGTPKTECTFEVDVENES